MRYYLGVDVGGSKSHALITDETGQAVGFGVTGAGNWEVVGYKGLTLSLTTITQQATAMAGISIAQIAGAGIGLGGFDWPSQRAAHLEAIALLGLQSPLEIVNDATLGIWAGTSQGWGVSVVAGSGCNVRALSRDHKREGRMIGGAGHWTGEWVGGYGVVSRALQAVTFEWNRRGPTTTLTPAFLQRFGAANLDDLMEGLYLERYVYEPRDALLVFQIARQGDPATLEVVRAVGITLGEMACGAIRQVGLENETFEVVLIGSLHDGHPLMADTMRQTIHRLAPGAQLARCNAPPVIGGVLLGMNLVGLETGPLREKVLQSANELLRQVKQEKI